MTAVTIATSEPNSTFHRQAVAIGEVLQEDGVAESTRTLFTNGSVENAMMVADGRATFATMAANWLPLATKGEPPFRVAIPVALMTPINSGPLFFVSRAEAPLRNFDDLKGCRVAIGPENSGMAQHIRTMLQALDLPFDIFEPVYITATDAVQPLIEGSIDAIFEPPIPNMHFNRLTESMPVRVLPFSPEQRRRILDAVPYYAEVTIPKSTFPGHYADVTTIAVVNILAVNSKADDDFVYRATRAFIAHKNDLPVRNPLFRGIDQLLADAGHRVIPVLTRAGAPQHPAAARAFRDAGLMS